MTPLDAQAKQELHDADLRNLMATPGGRRFVARLLEATGLYGSSYDPSSDRQTAFNEGRRSVAHALIADVHRVCPALWAIAQEERVHAYRDENALPLPRPADV